MVKTAKSGPINTRFHNFYSNLKLRNILLKSLWGKEFFLSNILFKNLLAIKKNKNDNIIIISAILAPDNPFV